MIDHPFAKNFTKVDLFKFTVPNICMMLFLSCYTIIDGMFISTYVGELALSATNMYFPITAFQLALSVMIGSGGSALIALKLGEQKEEKAREIFTLLTRVILVLGICITILFLFYLTSILQQLGTSELQLPYALRYATTLLYFSPFFMLQVVYQNFFVTAGKPKLGCMLTVVGGIVNIILDYLFLKVFAMGVEGAALATGIGYCVPSIFALFYFQKSRSIPLYYTSSKWDLSIIKHTCYNGISEFITHLSSAITTFLLNLIFLYYWNEVGVATITILSYFNFFIQAIYLGYSMGIAPIISYKYGAKDTMQLQCSIRYSIKFIVITALILYGFSNWFIAKILMCFTDNQSEVYQLTMYGFRYYSLQFLVIGFNIFASAMFTAFHNGKISGIISILRTFVFLIGCLLLFPIFLQSRGVWWALVIAEFLGFMVALYYMVVKKKEYQY